MSRASDIEIYQSAKPSTVTLMMLIDISGSMDYMSYGGGSACDAPNQSVKVCAANCMQMLQPIEGSGARWTSGGVTTEYPDFIKRGF